MPNENSEDEFVSKVGPVAIDWPRAVGYFAGIGAAVAFELIAPELGLLIAAVPVLKLLKRKSAPKVERILAAVLEGAAKPVGGDAEAAVRTRAEQDEKENKRAENRFQTSVLKTMTLPKDATSQPS